MTLTLLDAPHFSALQTGPRIRYPGGEGGWWTAAASSPGRWSAVLRPAAWSLFVVVSFPLVTRVSYFFTLVLGLDLSVCSWVRLASGPASSTTIVTVVAVEVSSHRGSFRSGHMDCFKTLRSRYNVKLHTLPISNAAQVLFRIVLPDGSLMNKYIFLVVISFDKAVTVLYVELFYRTGDFVGNNFLYNWLFLFDL